MPDRAPTIFISHVSEEAELGAAWIRKIPIVPCAIRGLVRPTCHRPGSRPSLPPGGRKRSMKARN